MLKTNHQYYLFIITNKKNDTLYIGVTNHLERRIFEHKNKLVEGFSAKYDLNKLMYFKNIPICIRRHKERKEYEKMEASMEN